MSCGARFRRLAALLASAGFALAAAAAPAEANRIIAPLHAAAPAAPTGAGGSGLLTTAAVLVLAGVGGWLLWRGRNGIGVGRSQRQLVIDETRSLGNRQYLVVASYQDKKFLLGVCPGRIDLLSPLHDPTGTPVIRTHD